jgi:rubrerythrin
MEPQLQAVMNALKIALQTERDGYRFYQEAATKTEDPSGKEMFERLARDEFIHERMVNERIVALKEKGQWNKVSKDEWRRSKMPVVKSPIFSREEIENNVSRYTYEISALRLAYLIEKDAATFYTQAAENIDFPEAEEMFRELAKWEKSHQDILQKEYEFLSDQFKTNMGFAPF